VPLLPQLPEEPAPEVGGGGGKDETALISLLVAIAGRTPLAAGLTGCEPAALVSVVVSLMGPPVCVMLPERELPTYIAPAGNGVTALGAEFMPPFIWGAPLLKEVGVPAPVGDIIPPLLEAGMPPMAPIPWLPPQAPPALPAALG